MDQTIRKQLEEIINKALANVVTKDDAKIFATKDDLKDLVTKDDAKSFLTKDDVKNFATKTDINNATITLRKEFKQDIEEAVGQIVSAIVPNIAEKETVEDLERRVTKLERKAKIN